GFFRLAHDLGLVDQVGGDAVPRAHRHQRQDDDGALVDEVAFFPRCLEAVRGVDFFGLLGSCRSGCVCCRCCCVNSWCCCVCRCGCRCIGGRGGCCRCVGEGWCRNQ